tara:strand:+ start:457 stop:855 length:399 start_codon:yes stop_codon:yes gene_type:complete
VKNYFAVSIVREAVEARGYIIKEKPQGFEFDLVGERSGFAEFFYVQEDEENIWNRREDYEKSTVIFNALGDLQKESFWYVIVCKLTKALIIAQSSGIFVDKYLKTKGERSWYELPNEKCFIINYQDFVDGNK